MQVPKRRKRRPTSRSRTVSTDELLVSAIGAHKDGKFDLAEKRYRQVLEQQPRNINALHFLGVLSHAKGNSDEAIRLIQRALFFDPDYLAARINCGNVLKETLRFADAETQFRKAILLDPKCGDAYNNLGTVLKAQGRIDAAVAAFEKAATMLPNRAEVYQNLGNALKKTDRIEDALTAYRRAIEIDPRQSNAHLNLGRALYRFGRVDESAIVYEKWLEIDPDNSIALHMLSACRGGNVPSRCSDEFVRESFDAFAESFDEVLERLEYRAPELVSRAVDEALPTGAADLRVLDVGCGTGLCAPKLRPHARELTGIDLSPKMVQKAERLSIYDSLEVAELTQYLLANANAFDLVVAADTLVYFGDLDDVFDAAHAAMRDSALFVFTVEAHREAATFELRPHGRYSHSESYLRTRLRDSGFHVSALKNEILRMEAEKPVEGFVVTAQRSA